MELDEKQRQKSGTQGLILCPTWHRPIFRIVPTGIEIKCKFCGGIVHKISRQEIEQYWTSVDKPLVSAVLPL